MTKSIKIESFNHHSRNRITLTDFGPSMTDQSFTSESDINNIVANYRKTSVIPQTINQALQYFDTTQVPSFQDAQNVVSRAKSMFEQLPAEIRFLCNNNPANVENILKDPRNTEILTKHGFLMETPAPAPEKPSNAPINSSGETSSQVPPTPNTPKEN